MGISTAYRAQSGETGSLLGFLGCGTRSGGGDGLRSWSTIEGSGAGVVVWYGLGAGCGGRRTSSIGFSFLGIGEVCLGGSLVVTIRGGQVFLALYED